MLKFSAVLPPTSLTGSPRVELLEVSRRIKDQYEITRGSKVIAIMTLDENKHGKFLNARRPVKALIQWVLETHAGNGQPRSDHADVTRVA